MALLAHLFGRKTVDDDPYQFADGDEPFVPRGLSYSLPRADYGSLVLRSEAPGFLPGARPRADEAGGDPAPCAASRPHRDRSVASPKNHGGDI